MSSTPRTGLNMRYLMQQGALYVVVAINGYVTFNFIVHKDIFKPPYVRTDETHQVRQGEQLIPAEPSWS